MFRSFGRTRRNCGSSRWTKRKPHGTKWQGAAATVERHSGRCTHATCASARRGSSCKRLEARRCHRSRRHTRRSAVRKTLTRRGAPHRKREGKRWAHRISVGDGWFSKAVGLLEKGVCGSECTAAHTGSPRCRCIRGIFKRTPDTAHVISVRNQHWHGELIWAWGHHCSRRGSSKLPYSIHEPGCIVFDLSQACLLVAPAYSFARGAQGRYLRPGDL